MLNEDFRPAPRLRLAGDAALLAPLRGDALRELAVMHRENVFDLPVYDRQVELESGERILCRRVGEQDYIEILGAQSGEAGEVAAAPAVRPPRRDGEFYVIPDCLARYDGLDSLQNAVPDGALAGWTLGLGADVTVSRPTRRGCRLMPDCRKQASAARWASSVCPAGRPRASSTAVGTFRTTRPFP